VPAPLQPFDLAASGRCAPASKAITDGAGDPLGLCRLFRADERAQESASLRLAISRRNASNSSSAWSISSISSTGDVGWDGFEKPPLQPAVFGEVSL
jgi:hypothetical protein